MSNADAGLDSVVAGLRCREVLDDLSDYLDGGLSPDRLVRIQAHLAGCDRCARFGGEVAETVTALRQTLQVPPPVDAPQAARIRAALRRVQGVA